MNHSLKNAHSLNKNVLISRGEMVPAFKADETKESSA